jgi:hypothetical protein
MGDAMGGAPRGAGTTASWDRGAPARQGGVMRPRLFGAVMVLAVVAGMVFLDLRPVHAGEETSTSGYKVLDPIRHGSLTVFPVVAAKSYATSEFMTLDEGLRSGDVVVTEYGNIRGLMRRRPAPAVQVQGAEVNRLVLINNSKRPLLLLAGEILAGGKQDRVIGKDRIVPPESDPVDLSVFCVEPGRWVATSEHFGTSGTTYGDAIGGPIQGAGSAGTMMAQPSVRAKAMGDKDQAEVWAEVKKQQQSVAVEVAAGPTASIASTQEIQSTSSYARVMENKDVKEKVDEIAAPIQQSYESLIKQLRDRRAVGVVVAVNGRIIWADVFASTELLERYWPKLVRSYASEAVVVRAKGMEVSSAQAEAFLADVEGRRETIEIEPGVYRHAEASGDGFKAFALTSLLPKTGFDLHIAKMAE